MRASAEGDRGALASRTKRSTSCIVYYCSTVKNNLIRTRIYPDECEHPPDHSILEVFGAVSVLQVYVNTMTLQHFLCLSRSVLPFLPNQITSLLLICDSPLPCHPLLLISFIWKCFGLLDKWFDPL